MRWPAGFPPEAPRPTSRSPTATRPLTTSSSASCGTCCSRSTSGHRPCSALCPEPCRAGEAAPARSAGGLWIAALPPPGRHGTGRRSTESRTAVAAACSSALVLPGAGGLREPGRAGGGRTRRGRRDDGPDLTVGGVVQVDDDRRVVARPGALAGFPVDPGGADPAGDGGAGEDQVDPH